MVGILFLKLNLHHSPQVSESDVCKCYKKSGVDHKQRSKKRKPFSLFWTVCCKKSRNHFVNDSSLGFHLGFSLWDNSFCCCCLCFDSSSRAKWNYEIKEQTHLIARTGVRKEGKQNTKKDKWKGVQTARCHWCITVSSILMEVSKTTFWNTSCYIKKNQ